jgi:flagellar hook-associated protein 3 FlgL
LTFSANLVVAHHADNVAFRSLLKSTLLVSATGDLPGLSQTDKDALVRAAQAEALMAKDQVVTAAGELGVMQEQLEINRVRLEAESSAADILRTELLSVDPYETASKLEDVNARLEFLYTVTARSRRLSFLEFMR